VRVFVRLSNVDKKEICNNLTVFNLKDRKAKKRNYIAFENLYKRQGIRSNRGKIKIPTNYISWYFDVNGLLEGDILHLKSDKKE